MNECGQLVRPNVTPLPLLRSWMSPEVLEYPQEAVVVAMINFFHLLHKTLNKCGSFPATVAGHSHSYGSCKQ